MKVALGKVGSQNHDSRHGIEGFEKENILKFRGKCKNTNLRHVFFIVISGDIFSKERMCRFGMVEDNRCERCELAETIKHIQWDCAESRKIWELFTEWIGNHALVSRSMNEYKDIFWVGDNAHVCKVKVKIIQEMIQIQRPSRWHKEKKSDLLVRR